MGARGQLARAHEERQATLRQQELARAEIQKYYAEQRLLDTASANRTKDDYRRHDRVSRERQAEQQMLESIRRTQASRAVAAEAAAEEEAVTAALAEQLRSSTAAAKELQRLREESHELRELAEKIRQARVNKERSLQLREKEELARQEAEYNRLYDQVLMAADREGLAAQEAAETARRAAGKLGLQVLEKQMQERLDLQRAAELEHQRERSMVDEVVARILAENQLEADAKRRKQEETKAYIQAFLVQREAELMGRKRAAAEEERKIQEYWDMVAARDAETAALASARQQAADTIYQKLKLEQEAQLRAKEEEDYLINLMREEEMAEKRRLEAEATAAKREAAKQEMLAANALQMQRKAEREAAQRAEEEVYRQRLMAQFAEADRVEQMNAQKRRIKIQEHKREVDRLLAEKRAMFEAALAAEAAQAAAHAAEESRKASLVEEERRRLLAEAAEFAEFLPPGALRNRADLEVLTSSMANSMKLGSTSSQRSRAQLG